MTNGLILISLADLEFRTQFGKTVCADPDPKMAAFENFVAIVIAKTEFLRRKPEGDGFFRTGFQSNSRKSLQLPYRPGHTRNEIPDVALGDSRSRPAAGVGYIHGHDYFRGLWGRGYLEITVFEGGVRQAEAKREER